MCACEPGLNQICPKCGAGGAGGKKTTPKKKPAPKFAMAGTGKANCGKLKPVATEKACRASAKVIKKQFGSAGTFASYPKGCFVYNNKLYFNNGKTGKANSKSNPVCVSGATGGKKTTPKKKPVCKCPKNMAPVCGKNGRTYGNACMAKCAKTAVVAKGACKKCPKVMIKCKCGHTYTMVKGCKVPKCKTTCDKKTTPKKKPANPCAKNNGGCAKARKCMNVKGKAMCGKCPKGYTNSGTKQCKKATATKKPTTKLVLAGKGKANCAGKGAPVKNEVGCKAAAKAMKKSFGGSSVKYTSFPKGCFLYVIRRLDNLLINL